MFLLFSIVKDIPPVGLIKKNEIYEVNIDDNGFIYVRKNGGVDIQCIPGSQVIIQTSSGEELFGIIGKKPIHLTAPEDRNKNIELHKYFLDQNMSSHHFHHHYKFFLFQLKH